MTEAHAKWAVVGLGVVAVLAWLASKREINVTATVTEGTPTITYPAAREPEHAL
jgi:hypothetical protein